LRYFRRSDAQARKLFWLNQLFSASFRLTKKCWISKEPKLGGS
jgi:hypothetical protein